VKISHKSLFLYSILQINKPLNQRHSGNLSNRQLNDRFNHAAGAEGLSDQVVSDTSLNQENADSLKVAEKRLVGM
jgi:hypothetical protein